VRFNTYSILQKDVRLIIQHLLGKEGMRQLTTKAQSCKMSGNKSIRWPEINQIPQKRVVIDILSRCSAGLSDMRRRNVLRNCVCTKRWAGFNVRFTCSQNS